MAGNAYGSIGYLPCEVYPPESSRVYSQAHAASIAKIISKRRSASLPIGPEVFPVA